MSTSNQLPVFAAAPPNNWARWMVIPLLLFLPLAVGRRLVSAEVEVKTVVMEREIYPSEWGVPHPEGVTYSAKYNLFYLLEKNPSEQAVGQSTVVAITPYEQAKQATRFNFNIGDTINLAFDDNEDRLFLLGGTPLQLVQIKVGSNGTLDPASERRIDVKRFGLINPEGMTVDHRGKFLFILDRSNSHVVRIDIKDPLERLRFETFDLASKGLGPLRGIAVNIENHHLFVMNPTKKVIHELTENFKYVAQYDISALNLVDPLALTFAYSPDRTDNDKIVHLFLADSHLPTAQSSNEAASEEALAFRTFLPAMFQSNAEAAEVESVEEEAELAAAAISYGKILELNLDESNSGPGAVDAASSDATLTLLQTIDTSAFSPPSPDPSGITFIAGAPGLFLLSDGEVEEMPIFAGKNLFGVTPPNSFTFSGGTTHYSNEPTDVDYDPANNRYFVSDDDQGRIFEVRPGLDTIFGTNDDTTTFFSTLAFGSVDPEGLDYHNGEIWIADGVNREVYRLNPGPTGTFNGVPAAGGDDIVSQFDVNILSVGDPEGIHFMPNGNLILTGRSASTIYEITSAGAFVRSNSIAAAGAVKLAGIVAVADVANPSRTHFWVVDRGIDNNNVPSENDGKLYEFIDSGVTPTPTPTPPPVPPATIYFGAADDGSVGGVAYSDEDIVAYDTTTGIYSMFFDGSANGVTSDVRGFERLADGTLLLNFVSTINVPGVSKLEPIDLLQFNPATGQYFHYFDGSDVGLSPIITGAIDALSVLPSSPTAPYGQILLSFTTARFNLTVGGTETQINDEDLLAFTLSAPPGPLTTGTWSFYFDGSDVGLNTSDSEDIKGAWINPANGEYYLNTFGVFSIPGLGGDGADIFVCKPGNPPGNVTTCTFRMFWDGSTHGFIGRLDSFAVQLH